MVGQVWRPRTEISAAAGPADNESFPAVDREHQAATATCARNRLEGDTWRQVRHCQQRATHDGKRNGCPEVLSECHACYEKPAAGKGEFWTAIHMCTFLILR